MEKKNDLLEGGPGSTASNLIESLPDRGRKGAVAKQQFTGKGVGQGATGGGV